MRYTLVPTSAGRPPKSRKPKPPKYPLKQRKGGKYGLRRQSFYSFERSDQTNHFKTTFNRVLSEWGIIDPGKRTMSWRIIYAHRIEPWHRSQDAMRQVIVGLHDLREMKPHTLAEEYAHIQRLRHLVNRKNYWAERSAKLWENPPIALRHVLKGAAPAVWKEFLRQM